MVVLPRESVDDRRSAKWILVVAIFLLASENLPLAGSLHWAQVPQNPYEVVKTSTAILTWHYQTEKDEKANFIEVYRKKEGIQSDIGNIGAEVVVYRDGMTLTTPTNQSLTLAINKVNTTDEADYCCEITPTKSAPKKTSCIYLKVLVPPELNFVSVNKTVNETGRLDLFCNVTGTPHPNISWTKVGSNNEIAKDGHLIISSVQKEDRGTYTCKASNKAGNITAKTYVKVQYKPRNATFSSTADKNTVMINDSVTFSCSADANPPAQVFKMYHKDTPLGQNDSFTIPRVAWFDRGEYTCVPVNILGNGDNASLTLEVLVSPQITIKPQNTTVNETNTVFLFCNATGHPMPNIAWLKDGRQVKELSKTRTLKIQSVTKKDAGVYTCSASSSAGQPATANAHVSVQYHPIIMPTSRTTDSWINHTTELACTVEGIPTPTISWSRPGTMRLETINRTHTTNKLVVIPRSPHDFGEYTCEAVNMLGRQTRSTDLKQLKPPGKPNISVESGKDDIAVHWTSPDDGGRPIMRYIVQIKERDGDQWTDCKDVEQEGNRLSCTFNDLSSGTEYVVRVFAVNIVGKSEPAVLELISAEEAKSSQARIAGFPPLTFWLIVGGGILFLIFTIVTVSSAVHIYKRRRRRAKTDKYNVNMKMNEVPGEQQAYSYAYGNPTQGDEINATEDDENKDDTKQPTN